MTIRSGDCFSCMRRAFRFAFPVRLPVSGKQNTSCRDTGAAGPVQDLTRLWQGHIRLCFSALIQRPDGIASLRVTE